VSVLASIAELGDERCHFREGRTAEQWLRQLQPVNRALMPGWARAQPAQSSILVVGVPAIGKTSGQRYRITELIRKSVFQ
jgi:hypothetical protein